MKFPFRRQKPQSPHVCDARVIVIRRGSALVEGCDGRRQCWCNFACLATHEKCEFTAEEFRAPIRESPIKAMMA